MEVFSKAKIRTLYRARARRYNWTANLYYLAGFREVAYRKKAIAELILQPGDTVVEIGCGTGLNFSRLQKAVGPNGRIIGVDMTTEMLDIARKRIGRKGWQNVTLIDCDAVDFNFPPLVDGVLSTFALSLVSGYDKVIKQGAVALKSGGRWVVLDFRLPENWPRWLVRFAAWLTRPFGVQLELGSRHPWESIRQHHGNLSFQTFYFGAAYIASGTRKLGSVSPLKRVTAYIDTLRVHWLSQAMADLDVEEIMVTEYFKPLSQTSRIQVLCNESLASAIVAVIREVGCSSRPGPIFVEVSDFIVQDQPSGRFRCRLELPEPAGV